MKFGVYVWSQPDTRSGGVNGMRAASIDLGIDARAANVDEFMRRIGKAFHVAYPDWRIEVRREDKARRNPTLVHHGKTLAARWHVLSDHGHAVADLYAPVGPEAAAKIAEEIATVLGTPVQVLSNRDQPGTLAAHSRLRSRGGWETFRGRAANPKRLKPAPGMRTYQDMIDAGDALEYGEADELPETANPKRRRRNPSHFTDVAVGQVRKLFPSGEVVRVDALTGNRARVKNLSRISTETMDARELKATSRVIPGRTPNPRRRSMHATIALPSAPCPVCGRECFIAGGTFVEHGGRAGACAGSGMPAPKANPKRRNPAKPHTIREALADLLMAAKQPDLARDLRAGAGDPETILAVAIARLDRASGLPRSIGASAVGLRRALELVRKLKPGQLEQRVNPSRRKANPKRRNAAGRRPRGNPSFRISGVLNAEPFTAPGAVPPSLLEAAGPLPYGGDVLDLDAMPLRRAPLALPPHVPARRARAVRAVRGPRTRTFQQFDTVTVPYMGKGSYFGRKVKKYRERATVQGMVTGEDGAPAVLVTIKRGRGFEHYTFPLGQVRKSSTRKTGSVAVRYKPQIAALMDKWRGNAEGLAAEIEAASAKRERLYDAVRFGDSHPDERGHQSAAYNRERGAFTRADTRLQMLENAAYHLAYEGGAVDPFAVANPGRLNSAELERAMRTFEMWHEFPAEKLTPITVHSRQMPRHLVALGKVRRIDYDSSKWEGRVVTYTHSTKRPYPTLATDPEARTLYLVGGKMKPTADGLVN